MTRTEELMKLAEAASNEDDDAMVELQFEGPTIKQLVELCRLQHDRLAGAELFVNSKECIKQPEGRDWYAEAIAAFNKFEGGE